MIEASIPLTLASSSHSEPFYHLAFLVFQSVSEQSELDNRRFVSEWSQLLLNYTHDEVRPHLDVLSISNLSQHVGQNYVDWTLKGLASLLHHCIRNLISRGEGVDDLLVYVPFHLGTGADSSQFSGCGRDPFETSITRSI